jgi:hypothetical protein
VFPAQFKFGASFVSVSCKMTARVAQVTICVIVLLQLASLASPRTLETVRKKRHTPFLPGDYWKDNRPDFGYQHFIILSLHMLENSCF